MRSPFLDPIECRLLETCQRDFPLTLRPFRAVADELALTEIRVLGALNRLARCGVVSRIGAVFRPHGVGTSTLAAMRVPPERLEAVAILVTAYEEVNHNYEREHTFNLWFVATASNDVKLARVLDDIARRTDLPVLNLPLVQSYHLDLGFPLSWT